MALVLGKTKKIVLSGLRRCFSDNSFSVDFESNGWVFQHCKKPFGEADRQKFAYSLKNLLLPERFGDEDVSITHQFTGLKICFNPLHALIKYGQECQTGEPSHSEFPSYASPFRPTWGSFDSAYTGKFYRKSPGKEEYGIINPRWDYVDWNAACQRIVWLSKWNPWLLFEPNLSVGAQQDTIFIKRNLYSDCSTGQSASYNLVVNPLGWWLRLDQTYPFSGLTKRVMDMHFIFTDNKIYREIIEFQREDPRAYKALGDKSIVSFHEISQLNLQDGCMGVSVENETTTKCVPFTVDELLASSDTGLTLSKEEVGKLFDDCGSRVKSFEKDTKTSLEVSPMFGVPQGKHVYLSGAKKDVEAAKLTLKYEYLGRSAW